MHCFLCGLLFSNSIGYGAGVTSAVFPGYSRVNGPSQAWGAWSCTHIVKQWSTGENAHRRCTRDCSYHWWVILHYRWINFCQTYLLAVLITYRDFNFEITTESPLFSFRSSCTLFIHDINDKSDDILTNVSQPFSRSSRFVMLDYPHIRWRFFFSDFQVFSLNRIHFHFHLLLFLVNRLYTPSFCQGIHLPKGTLQ